MLNEHGESIMFGAISRFTFDVEYAARKIEPQILRYTLKNSKTIQQVGHVGAEGNQMTRRKNSTAIFAMQNVGEMNYLN